MKPEAPDDSPASFKTRRRVEFRDTDAAGIVHFSAFFFWMESAEHELLRAAGVDVFHRQQDGSESSWPRVSASCDYRSAIRFGDEIEIGVQVAALGRSSVTYRFIFEHAGRLVAEGRVVAVRCLLEPGGRLEPAAIPEAIAARLVAAAGGPPPTPGSPG